LQKDQEIANQSSTYSTQLSNLNSTYLAQISNLRSAYLAEIKNLNTTYSTMNASYSQTLKSLQQMTELVNTTESELSKLNQDYLTLNTSYVGLCSAINSFSQTLTPFGGRYGVVIMNYSVTYLSGVAGFRYVAEITLYNLIGKAQVQVELYGSTTQVFTFSVDGYSEQTFAQSWSTGFQESYPSILIENVTRS
jgi:hypothetical protein